MRYACGMLMGLSIFVFGFALFQMMVHGDLNVGVEAVAGLGTFVVACLVSLAIIR